MDAAKGFSGLRARKGRPLMERLMERVHPVPFSGCWLWTGGLNGRGYGWAFLPGGARTTAHRAMLIAVGRDLRPGDVVRHSCDVTSCVNPDHLTIGTQAENMKDMLAKGRHKPAYRIPAEWRAKIREDKTPAWAVAKWFGVDRKTINNIRAGRVS